MVEMLRHILANKTTEPGSYCREKKTLYKNRCVSQEELAKSQQTIILSGATVDVLKANIFVGAVDTKQEVTFRYQQSDEETARSMSKSKPCISEAAFQYLGLFYIVDMLVIKEASCHGYPLDKTIQVKSTILQIIKMNFNL